MSAKQILNEQNEKSHMTDAAQRAEPELGADAVRAGLASRHERADGEERDSLHDNHGNQTEHGDEGHHIVSVATYLKVFGALMVLLVLTLVVYFFMDLSHVWGPANIIVAMIIAIAKALLVILFFMHVKFSSKITWLFSSAGFVFIAILFVLCMNDYMTRGYFDSVGK